MVGLHEQLILRGEVVVDSCGSNAQLVGDVREAGAVVAIYAIHPIGNSKQSATRLFGIARWWQFHRVSNRVPVLNAS